MTPGGLLLRSNWDGRRPDNVLDYNSDAIQARAGVERLSTTWASGVRATPPSEWTTCRKAEIPAPPSRTISICKGLREDRAVGGTGPPRHAGYRLCRIVATPARPGNLTEPTPQGKRLLVAVAVEAVAGRRVDTAGHPHHSVRSQSSSRRGPQ